MGTISDIYEKIKSIDIWEEAVHVLKSDTDVIAELNKDQLRAGVLSTGRRTPKHTLGLLSWAHVLRKIQQNKMVWGLLPHMNFYDSGDFYRGFRVLFQDGNFSLTSTDSKTDDLEYRTSYTLFGLTSESIAKLIDLKKNAIIKAYKQKLQI